MRGDQRRRGRTVNCLRWEKRYWPVTTCLNRTMLSRSHGPPARRRGSLMIGQPGLQGVQKRCLAYGLGCVTRRVDTGVRRTPARAVGVARLAHHDLPLVAGVPCRQANAAARGSRRHTNGTECSAEQRTAVHAVQCSAAQYKAECAVHRTAVQYAGEPGGAARTVAAVAEARDLLLLAERGLQKRREVFSPALQHAWLH